MPTLPQIQLALMRLFRSQVINCKDKKKEKLSKLMSG